MRTILYSGCYLEGEDLLGNSRLERNFRYVDFYSNRKEDLGFEKILLLDNGSSYMRVLQFLERVNKTYLQFKSVENLVSEGPNHYPYCWRFLYHIEELIREGYEKIIMIDSDGFIFSKKMTDYIKNLNSGWTTFWCKRWEFPEASIQILCKDAFYLFYNFIKIPYERRLGSIMEITLPFTKIEEGFNCDRFGETDDPVSDEIDYYGQARPTLNPHLFWR